MINDFDGGKQENFFEIKDGVSCNLMFYLEIQMKVPKTYQAKDEINV